MMRSSAGRLLFTAAAFTLFVNDGAYYGRAVVAGRRCVRLVAGRDGRE